MEDSTLIGGRRPNFIRQDGIKEVIVIVKDDCAPESVLDEVAHYSKYGYKCIIIREEECYSKEALDRIFGLDKR